MSKALALNFMSGDQMRKLVFSYFGYDYAIQFNDPHNQTAPNFHYEVTKEQCEGHPEIWKLLQRLRIYFRKLKHPIYLSEDYQPEVWMIICGDIHRVVFYFFRAPSGNRKEVEDANFFFGALRITNSGNFSENLQNAECFPKGRDEFFLRLWRLMNQLIESNKTLTIQES